MESLTNLVVEYQKEKNQITLLDIFKLLKNTVKEKTDFVYYKKFYPLNLYDNCKYCKTCEHNKELKDKIAEIKRREICENCQDCICEKGYFNLRKNNLCDYKDIEQELKLEILRLINNFDIKVGEFKNYLSASLWDWRPSFITSDYVNSLSFKKIYQETDTGEELEIKIVDKKEENQRSNLNLEDIIQKCKTDNERQIVKLLIQNPNLSQRDIAKKLKKNKDVICRIFNKLRNRLR